MALYRVMIGSKEYNVDVSDDKISVNGEPVEAKLDPLNTVGSYMMKWGHIKRELHIAPRGESQFAILLDGHHIIAQVEKATNRLRQKLDPLKTGDLVAPMPGLVIAVSGKEGDVVEKGQILVVLESMKMQMDFHSPFKGKLMKLFVQSGLRIDKGTVMAQVAEI